MPIAVESESSLRTLSRASALLQHLAGAPMRCWRLTDLAVASGLHKATVHRLLGGLMAEGLVQSLPGGYTLGPQAWLIGRAAAQRFDLSGFATPLLRRVAQETGDVALLGVMIGHHVHCMAREEGDSPILPTSIRVGAIRPLGCGAHALALLAALPAAEVERAITVTAPERVGRYAPITDDYLRRSVVETQAQGYAVNEGVIVSGMTAVAVAVRDSWGRPIAALSCSAISERLLPERRPFVVALLRQEAGRLEAMLRPATVEAI
ncbi:IclR family transcriptional regulator [Roseomonas marmotae]|uniref:IclR family transcriptional regulator n=1 Tax=Roseomonas marmotae TaxID=2768161 RepID=A0ABS3KGH0_9PROT|nr:IclR family transcriptional regulator [Roseomonas marmotae]MBO1076549.1 IclR family transcriptional regulator [Roseomonas marmotae]QTI81836.1 IclR family transcriptional regulator [Roseomonas marmotae]